MTLREPQFDHDLVLGQQAEMFVEDIRAGFSGQRVETKYDLKAASTGRLFIEYECLRRRAYCSSGLQETASLYWCVVLDAPHAALLISTERLRELTRHAWVHGSDTGARRGDCQRGSHPTRGVLLDIGRLVASCREALH